MKKLISLLLSIIIAFSVCCVSGFAENNPMVICSEYFSEEYIYAEFYDSYYPNESGSEIELTYESGRKIVANRANDETSIKENEYFVVLPNEQCSRTGLLIMADSEFSEDRITEINFAAESFVLNGTELSSEEISTVNDTKSQYTYKFSFTLRRDHKGNLTSYCDDFYVGCSAFIHSDIPNGLLNTFSLEITTPSGVTTTVINGIDSDFGYQYLFEESGEYTFTALCNGKICYQVKKDVPSKEEAKKEKIKYAMDQLLYIPRYCVEAVLLSPLLLLFTLCPAILLLNLPIGLFAEMFSDFSELFNILFKF